MKNILRNTTRKKTKQEKMSFTIKVNPVNLPNKMHLDAQINFPALVQEDKRKKAPKYKNKLLEGDE